MKNDKWPTPFWVRPFMDPPQPYVWDNHISNVPQTGWLKCKVVGYEVPVSERKKKTSKARRETK